MKQISNKTLIIFLTLLGLLPVGLYIYKFHYGLTDIHSRWGEFGSFLSPMVGLLAFAGVLYSIEITKDQFKQQSEDNGFFSLINIYRSNLDKLYQNQGGKQGDPFDKYIKRFEEIFEDYCFYFAQEAIINDLKNVHENGYEFLFSKITRKESIGEDVKETVNKYFENRKTDKDEALKCLVDGNSSDEDKDKMRMIGHLYFEDSSSEYRIRKLSMICEHFDDDCGKDLSHYFQYIFCILDYANSSVKQEKYIKILNSLFSRNELILLFYNTVNPLTDKKFNELIFKLRVLDKLYTPGLCYTAHDVRISKDLEEIKIKSI